MEPFLPIIVTGVQIIGNLVNGYNDRETMKLNISAYEKEARLEMKKIQLEAKLNKEAQEQNLSMLRGILEIIKDLVRTDVELSIVVQQVGDSRTMLIGDWITTKKREISDLNNEQVKQLQEFLLKAKELDELDRERFKVLVYENFEHNKISIQKNNEWLLKQAEDLVTKSGIELTSVKEDFKQLAGMDTLKLLERG